MKEKQYLVTEGALEYLYSMAYSDGNYKNKYDPSDSIDVIPKNPVSTLDRDKVEQELYDMIGGLNETEYGEQINECVHIASKNICSLAVQPVDRDREKIMLNGIKAYQRMITAYRLGEKKIPEWVFENIGKLDTILIKLKGNKE
jgi:hypothetical protein